MAHKTTRRNAASGLAALLTIPSIARAAPGGSPLAAAKDEGTLTWYIAQVDAQTAEDLGRAFTHSNRASMSGSFGPPGRSPISGC